MASISILEKFRKDLYSLFPKRRDAIFEFIDALSSHGHIAKSVVELSEATCFTRKYTSITDALGDGMPFAKKDAIAKLVFDTCSYGHNENYHLFALDATAQPRFHAKKLRDRSIVHAPTYTPGQKPIALGHQYSTITWLPQGESDKKQHWVVPISAQRVPSNLTGHSFGMHQLTNMIDDLGLGDQLVVNVADSAYGAEACRSQGLMQDNLVHIFRIRNNRNIYYQPAEESRKKYDDKMVLSDNDTHRVSDDSVIKKTTTVRGKQYQVEISRWNNMLLRGSHAFKSYKYPLDLIQVTLRPVNNDGSIGEQVKRPMWLGVQGKRRRELSTDAVYQDYSQRFDIEHFFRFGKTRLLLDKFQTPDTEHEESYWFLCMTAYAQLYLARNDAGLHLKDWEKYQNKYRDLSQATPTQVQRSFNTILKQIGTPALPAKSRGKPLGRKQGESVLKREEEKIIIKGNTADVKPKIQLLGFGKDVDCSNLQSLAQATKSLPAKLKKIGFSLLDFKKVIESALDST